MRVENACKDLFDNTSTVGTVSTCICTFDIELDSTQKAIDESFDSRSLAEFVRILIRLVDEHDCL